MNKFKNGKWNADAEVAMMGVVINVADDEHVEYMTAYVLNMLKNVDNGELEGKEPTELAKEVLNNAYEYNSGDAKITHFSVNAMDDTVMLAFVRDEEMDKVDDENGALCYVHNVFFPFFSELGYCFFKNKNGVMRRIG